MNVTFYMILRSNELDVNLSLNGVNIEGADPATVGLGHFSSEDIAEGYLSANIKHCRKMAESDPSYLENLKIWESSKIHRIEVSVKAEPM